MSRQHRRCRPRRWVTLLIRFARPPADRACGQPAHRCTIWVIRKACCLGRDTARSTSPAIAPNTLRSRRADTHEPDAPGAHRAPSQAAPRHAPTRISCPQGERQPTHGRTGPGCTLPAFQGAAAPWGREYHPGGTASVFARRVRVTKLLIKWSD